METQPYQTKAERLKALADAAERSLADHTDAAERAYYEGRAYAFRRSAELLSEGPATTHRTELRRLAHAVEFALGRLAHGSPSQVSYAVDVLAVALDGLGERVVDETKREPSRSDRERRLLQRLAKRSWRSTGRRLRGQTGKALS